MKHFPGNHPETMPLNSMFEFWRSGQEQMREQEQAQQ